MLVQPVNQNNLPGDSEDSSLLSWSTENEKRLALVLGWAAVSDNEGKIIAIDRRNWKVVDVQPDAVCSLFQKDDEKRAPESNRQMDYGAILQFGMQREPAERRSHTRLNPEEILRVIRYALHDSCL